MRPRWRSRGDGPADCIRRTAASAEDGGSRACCCARNAAQPQGKKVGGAVAGQGRAGAKPAEMRGRIGASLALSAETTLAVGASSARSALAARQPSRCHGHHASRSNDTHRARHGTDHVDIGFGLRSRSACRRTGIEIFDLLDPPDFPGVNKHLEGTHSDKTKA